MRISTVAMVALMAVSCMAQQPRTPEQQSEQFFNRFDTNKDGKLSLEEFPERGKAFHPRLDADNDGFVSKEEDLTFRRNRAVQPANRARGNRPSPPPPTHANVAYGPHERNVLDFWQADSDEPTPVLVFFHGGGFRNGDKAGVNLQLLASCMEAGISCAAANYRLTGTDPYPAQMHDAARAIQFIRSKADEWNIDASRLASYGGSAGAGISLWLGMHDDLADPDSDDPVAQQSTRLSSAIGLQAQCTYDPRIIREIVPGRAYNDGALKPLYGLPQEWNWDTDEISDELSALLDDASPIFHLTEDDCPVFVYHRSAQDVPGNIHHANFGRHLKAAMDEISVECIHKMDTDYEAPNGQFTEVFEFVKRHFKN